jgi:hypothetical protein
MNLANMERAPWITNPSRLVRLADMIPFSARFLYTVLNGLESLERNAAVQGIEILGGRKLLDVHAPSDQLGPYMYFLDQDVFLYIESNKAEYTSRGIFKNKIYSVRKWRSRFHPSPKISKLRVIVTRQATIPRACFIQCGLPNEVSARLPRNWASRSNARIGTT